MTPAEFKKLFFEVAAQNGFSKEFEGIFVETQEVTIALDLQKSAHGRVFYLNIKLFVQGLFGKKYEKSKELVTKEIGNVFTREPQEYKEAFNLENSLSLEDRRVLLSRFFSSHFKEFIQESGTRKGILNLGSRQGIFILPAVRNALESF